MTDEQVEDEDEDVEIPLESKIGKTLSDRTIRTVVMLVLCMLFLLPVFQIDTWVETTTAFTMGLRQVRDIY